MRAACRCCWVFVVSCGILLFPTRSVVAFLSISKSATASLFRLAAKKRTSDENERSIHHPESFTATITAPIQDATKEAAASQTTSSAEKNNMVIGLPPWLQELGMNETLYMQRRRQHENKTSNAYYSIECVSTSPPIYILRDLLSPQECLEISQQALEVADASSEQGQTRNNQGILARPNSRVIWLEEYDDLASEIAATCLSLPNGAAAWVESLQVVTYSQQGQYVLHHDGHERILTCLYYLNGVGGTWFPLAGDTRKSNKQVPSSREEAMELARDCFPGKDGLLLVGTEHHDKHDFNENVVQIQAGDAVLFYNYVFDNESSTAVSDWTTIHAGLPCSETKLICNHWFHVGEE